MCGCNQGKKAHDTKASTRIQETYTGKPHGAIQWKGTEVCMDVYCACGHHSHIDASFASHVECSACHRVYSCNPNIELIELTVRPDHSIAIDEAEHDR